MTQKIEQLAHLDWWMCEMQLILSGPLGPSSSESDLGHTVWRKLVFFSSRRIRAEQLVQARQSQDRSFLPLLSCSALVPVFIANAKERSLMKKMTLQHILFERVWSQTTMR
jgi:hypothetical protein